MRTYEMFLLRFSTPVHFGDAGEGGGLGDVIPFCRADTFFSALCNEAAKIDRDMMQKLVKKAGDGEILFADLMPWYRNENSPYKPGSGKINDSYEFYIPRPLLNVSSERVEKPLSYSETKRFSTLRKGLKKRAYVRASQSTDYLNDIRLGIQTVDQEPEFGKYALVTQYNSRTKMPYDIGQYHFAENCGLYLILSAIDANDLTWLEMLIRLVGLNGIGGRRSSGNGKFGFEAEPVILPKNSSYGEDVSALYTMLENEESNVQMTLSSLLPAKDDLEFVCEGNGKLVKRSGFAYSMEIGKPVKENSVFMMAAGSCFRRRIAGTIVDVNTGVSPHPVYRYGKGIYVGLTL